MSLLLPPLAMGRDSLYSLNLFFDEPLLATLDGSKVSIRQKYANTALTYKFNRTRHLAHSCAREYTMCSGDEGPADRTHATVVLRGLLSQSLVSFI